MLGLYTNPELVFQMIDAIFRTYNMKVTSKKGFPCGQFTTTHLSSASFLNRASSYGFATGRGLMEAMGSTQQSASIQDGCSTKVE